MNRDETFINHLLNSRIILKKIAKFDDISQLYGDKYKKWIMPFLNKHGIDEVPMMVFCHTLKQTPDFFNIGKKSFFVVDYSMYNYFHDINYTFLNYDHREYIANIYLKGYIEQAYLKNRIDFCHYLCSTVTSLEDYKDTSSYKNDNTIKNLSYQTDLQEAFLLLHEASHFLFNTYPDVVKESIGYHTLKDCLQPIINRNKKISIDDSFYEECYCDYQSIFYILTETFSSTKLCYNEYFTLFFRALVNVYITLFFARCQDESYELENDLYGGEYFTLFSMRLANLYNTIHDYLFAHRQKELLATLDSVYHASIEEFAAAATRAYIMSQYLEDNTSKFIIEYEYLSKKDKVCCIEDFLLLSTNPTKVTGTRIA